MPHRTQPEAMLCPSFGDHQGDVTYTTRSQSGVAISQKSGAQSVIGAPPMASPTCLSLKGGLALSIAVRCALSAARPI